MKLSPLDKVYSEAIRRRAILRTGGCERCQRPYFDTQKENGDIFPAWKHLQCAHLIDRRKRSVRWDESNGTGLCAGCHTFIDRDHRAKEQFCLELLGIDEYNSLQGRERQTHPKPDEKLLLIYYQNLIKELSNGM